MANETALLTDTELESQEVSLTTAVSPWVRLTHLVAAQRTNLQNLSVLVVFNFFGAGLSFLTQIKIANTLGKVGFGEFAFALAIGAYGQAIICFGMDRTLVRDLVHNRHHFAELVVASLILRYALALLVLVGLVAWIVLGHASGSWLGLFLVAFSNSMLSLDLQPVYDVWRKMQRHATYFLLYKLIYLGAVWAIVVAKPMNLTVPAIGLAALMGVSVYLIVQHRWVMRQVGYVAISRNLVRRCISLARQNVWVWLAALGCLSFGRFNQLILKHYAGLAELGTYAAAWQIVMIGMLFLAQVSRIGRPAAARHTCAGISRKIRVFFLCRYGLFMLSAVLPLALAMLLFPQRLFALMFKPEYVISDTVVRLLGVYILVFSLGLVGSQYVLSAHMERAYFCSILVGSILSIITSLALAPTLGSLGAVISVLVSHGTTMGLYWIAILWHLVKMNASVATHRYDAG